MECEKELIMCILSPSQIMEFEDTERLASRIFWLVKIPLDEMYLPTLVTMKTKQSTACMQAFLVEHWYMYLLELLALCHYSENQAELYVD